MAATSLIESCRFSSADLRPADRLPFYREVLGRMVGDTNIEPVGESFSCNGRFYLLPGLGLSGVGSSAIRGRRTQEMTAGNEDLLLIASFRGTGRISQFGHEAMLPAGSAVLVSGADPCHVQWTESYRCNVRVPRVVLAPMLADLDGALMSVIPGTIEPLRHLTRYTDLLVRDSLLMEADAQLRALAVHHIHDLVAMAVGATRDAAETAAGRGLRAARLGAIKADITRNLAGDVSVAGLSARHRLTPRYIRKLFEGANTSLSRFVLLQRLARVHRMLSDPRHVGRTIGDIALSVGFGDISTFNREFRRQFGMTPSEVRATARNAMM